MSLGRVSIIGLGLMGGSLGLALRKACLATEIVGCGRPALQEKAIAMGAIDRGTASTVESVAGCDYIFLCTPVETSIRLMRAIAPALAPGAVITDVGSTKQAFAEAAHEVFGDAAEARVFPGHPLAGRELSGLEHALPDLYAGCLWVMTPLGDVSSALRPAAHTKLIDALLAIGARVAFLDPVGHDHTLAYTSHLPQMLSTTLALTLERALGPENPALEVHAGGLLSMLRLAESDPAMWQQIATSNRANLCEALESFERELRQLREQLGGDQFRSDFERARRLAQQIRRS